MADEIIKAEKFNSAKSRINTLINKRTGNNKLTDYTVTAADRVKDIDIAGAPENEQVRKALYQFTGSTVTTTTLQDSINRISAVD